MFLFGIEFYYYFENLRKNRYFKFFLYSNYLFEEFYSRDFIFKKDSIIYFIIEINFFEKSRFEDFF